MQECVSTWVVLCGNKISSHTLYSDGLQIRRFYIREDEPEKYNIWEMPYCEFACDVLELDTIFPDQKLVHSEVSRIKD